MTWHLELGDDEIVVTHDTQHDVRWTAPLGVRTLGRELQGDPPRPEELTNAVGAVADHLDDLVRARPDLAGAPVSMSGPEITAVVAVEVGGTPPLPFTLDRAAAEDVFRTLATEPRSDRARNPGLDPLLVDRVVAGSCAVVAVIRKLQLDAIEVRP